MVLAPRLHIGRHRDLAEIDRLLALHGKVVLYDAHSIRSRAPRLFPGERPPLDARPGRGGDLLARVAAGEGVALMLSGQRLPAGLVSRPLVADGADFAVQAWWRADHGSPVLARLLPLLGA